MDDAQPVFDAIFGCRTTLFEGTQQTALLFDESRSQPVLAAHNGPAHDVIERYFPAPLQGDASRWRCARGACCDSTAVLHGTDTPPVLREIIGAMDIGDCAGSCRCWQAVRSAR